jgi:hypothetical protein
MDDSVERNVQNSLAPNALFKYTGDEQALVFHPELVKADVAELRNDVAFQVRFDCSSGGRFAPPVRDVSSQRYGRLLRLKDGDHESSVYETHAVMTWVESPGNPGTIAREKENNTCGTVTGFSESSFSSCWQVSEQSSRLRIRGPW